MNFKNLVILSILLSISSILYSQTYVAGVVSGVWEKSNSPYIVKDHINVPKDSSLFISPGTKILFEGHYKFIINGLLEAIGNETDSILFSSNYPDSTWGGIRFIAADSNSTMSYCIIEKGKVFGDSFESAGGGIFCDSSSITIDHNTIRNNSSYSTLFINGGGISCVKSNPFISGNIIAYNRGWGGAGGGIFCINSSPKIMYNYIHHNESRDISGDYTPCGGGIVCSQSSARIQNNVIFKNESYEGGGIACFGEPACEIINNTIVLNTGMTGGVVTYHSPTTYINNIIYYNGYGKQVLNHYEQATLRFNDIENFISPHNEYYNDYANFNSDPGFIDLENNNFHLSDTSLCIDAGAPEYSFSKEPYYNGMRINLGAYGNTPEAMTSYPSLKIFPENFTFKTINASETDSLILNIYNTGRTRLNIDSLYILNSSCFNIYSPTRYSILPNDSIKISVLFEPDAPGDYFANLIIVNNDIIEYLKSVNLSGKCQFQNAPVISKIKDIPNDQGGWVSIDFSKSIFDTDSLILPKTNSMELYTIELNDGDEWIGVGSTIAYGKSRYSVLVPTTKDSTNENNGKINFRVIAGMNEGNFVSEIRSGYSVDNLKPAVPSGLHALLSNSIVQLTWEKSPTPDFNYFNIYRTNQGIERLIAQTIDTAFNDNNIEFNQNYSYSITALDFSGNESQMSSSVDVHITEIINDSQPPNKFYLAQNYPNPFNPSTQIKYGLKEATYVKLYVYDIIGKRIKNLVEQYQNAGNYNVQWDGTNNNGNKLVSGIYFYQIVTEEFIQINKMILLK